jgi:hypothetical protein
MCAEGSLYSREKIGRVTRDKGMVECIGGAAWK